MLQLHKIYINRKREVTDMSHGDIAENKVRISLVLPKILKEDLKLMADEDDRSFNNMVVKILAEYRETFGVNYGLKNK